MGVNRSAGGYLSAGGPMCTPLPQSEQRQASDALKPTNDSFDFPHRSITVPEPQVGAELRIDCFVADRHGAVANRHGGG